MSRLLDNLAEYVPSSIRLPMGSRDSQHPLLPANGHPADHADEDAELDYELQQSDAWRLDSKWPKWMPIAAVAVLGLLAVAITVSLTSKKVSSIEELGEDSRNMAMRVNAEIDELFARQSSTLAQASARYSLKTGRTTPRNYDKWYKFAREKHCLIDDYNQIYRDFEPFYTLAKDDPTFFNKMAQLGIKKVQEIGAGMKSFQVRNGVWSQTEYHSTLYDHDWQRKMDHFAADLPDLEVMLNGRDEPRVVFNYREPNARKQALNVSDETPFEHKPHPTSHFFKDEKRCLVPNKPTGFTGLANDVNAFLLSSASTEFTTDFYPMLSMTKISPCFADILVPSEFYDTKSHWFPHYKFPNPVKWADKKPQLYWRGATSGGWFSGDNYRHFPRFRLIDIARKHSDILDVGLTTFSSGNCDPKECDEAKMKAEYGINGRGAPREEVYNYKYVFDVDGNSFSGRYFGLLTSGTLVFKSTIFEEYFNDWLQPFVHYIPVLPDLSDLVNKVEWAIANDAEARRIQEAGKQFTTRVLTDEQNDCYYFLVLLEWARLQEYAGKEATRRGWAAREE